MLVIDLVSDNPANKFAPYQHMANAIIDLTQKNGECSPRDLLPLGFSKKETEERWHMANAMANIELKLMKRVSFLTVISNKFHCCARRIFTAVLPSNNNPVFTRPIRVTKYTKLIEANCFSLASIVEPKTNGVCNGKERINRLATHQTHEC